MIFTKYNYIILSLVLIPALSFADKIYQCPSSQDFKFTGVVITGQMPPGGWPSVACLYSSPYPPVQPVCYGYPPDGQTQFKGAEGSKWTEFDCVGTQEECKFRGADQLTIKSYAFPDCDFLPGNKARQIK